MSDRAIVIVKDRIPYPMDIGSDVVSFSLLRVLQRAFSVTLVAADEGDRASEGAEALRALGVEVLLEPRRGIENRPTPVGAMVRNARLIFGQRSRFLQSQTAPSLELVLDQLTARRSFAFAQFENWPTARYRPFVHCRASLLNFDAWFRTVEAFARYERSPVKKLLWSLEARAVHRYETAAQQRFDWRLFLSEEDRYELMKDENGSFTAVLPVPFPFTPADPASVGAPRLEPAVLFVGAMNVEFNIDAVCHFVEHIWPEVRRAVPQATFVVAGRKPVERVQRLAREPDVRIEPNPQLDALLLESRVSVSPARLGTGIKVKVAQAMAAGLPVVGTPSGLSGFAHVECLLTANDPASFARQVVHLLQDEAYRQQMGRACLAFYRDQLWTESTRPRVLALYAQMIDGLERSGDASVRVSVGGYGQGIS